MSRLRFPRRRWPAVQAPYSGRDAPPLPYPVGWFMLAPSRDLRPGEVLTRRLMGEDVVVYRTRGGRPRVVRPYCPHLGAHLGCGGRVDGELLVCPFHHFAFDAAGVVARVGPGYTGEQVNDRLTVLPCEEASGGVFTWVGATPNQPPSWPLPSLLTGAGANLRFVRIEVGTHPQEILENTADLGHLRALHGFSETELIEEPVRDGHTYRIKLRTRRKFPPFGSVGADVTITHYGLGLTHAMFREPRVGLNMDVVGALRPVADWRTEMLYAVDMRIGTGQGRWPLVPLQAGAVLRDVTSRLNLFALKKDFVPDLAVWNAKVYTAPPRLAHGDGPIGTYRKWAQQFYPDLP